jgi:DNA invertase Pin-like site-specific DNA recombinase
MPNLNKHGDTALRDLIGFMVSIKEEIDTSSANGRFLLGVFSSLAQFERENLLERQREGIEIAKANGKHLGRPKAEVNKKKFVKQYQLWKAGEQTAVETMKKLDLKRDTFYRMVKQYEADKAQPQ